MKAKEIYEHMQKVEIEESTQEVGEHATLSCYVGSIDVSPKTYLFIIQSN